MRNARSFVGLPVLMGGKRVGRTLDVGVSADLTRLTGVYVDCGLRGSRFVEAGRVEMLGDVAILVRSLGVRAKPKGEGRLRRAVSTDGRRLGAICGVWIDAKQATVAALELSRGFFDEMRSGRELIRAYTAASDGDVVVETTKGGEEA